MYALRARSVWVGRGMALLGLLVLFTACSTTATVVATPPVPPSDDDDFSELIAQLRSDLNRHNGRQTARTPSLTPTAPTTAKARDKEFTAKAKALFETLNGTGLLMPVVGVQPFDLSNSWGDSRDGGRRKHRGIDNFAAKGTAVVAVADGIVSYIGDQPKGGHCLWLSTENGKSFYYAHLDKWAPGLYEGMEVRSGDLLGYVGNTGNAKYTPAHLHFAVNENDEMVNPYPLLTRAAVVKRAHVATESAAAMGTR